MTAPVLIMAGGTGGHVYPALAVAKALVARRRPVVWLGTRAGIEARIVPGAGLPIEWIRIGGLRGKGALTWFAAPFRLARAIGEALVIVRRIRPAAVLGMGGFASGPGGFAAWLLRRPLVIHEQNAVAGLTNRLLAKFARVVLEAFPGSFSSLPGVVAVGNPVRPEIANLPAPSARAAARAGPLNLLVLGGSLGALALNRGVPAALAGLSAADRPVVRHQSGELTLDAARDAYRAAGVDATVMPFIEDMAEAYAWADVVVCRAGALTVAELAAAGLAALFVPFPHAVDDHQTANAASLVSAGAAVILPEADLTPRTLLEKTRRARHDARRTRGSRRARADGGRAGFTRAYRRRLSRPRRGCAMTDRMRRINRIHFIGIGGVGMGGIAEVLHNQGYQVQGSDLSENAVTRRLAKLGCDIRIGHAAANSAKADVVVVSSAVDDDNVELAAAHERRCPVVMRAEMLGELMRFSRNSIAVAGTHGKTTTTSLIASVLAQGGLDPTFVIGGRLKSADTNARLGTGDYLVAEADESDASFMHLQPMFAVVTNIDADHLDTYGGDVAQLHGVFIEFLHNLPFYGLAVLCADDPGIIAILGEVNRPIVTYGIDNDADVMARDIAYDGASSRFVVERDDGRAPLTIRLNLPGRHNVLNTLAAIAMADEIGVPDEAIVTALAEFEGIDRRFQILGECRAATATVLVVDDYGHHPTEIAATLAAARAGWPDRRLVLVFQPHRYTRTRDLLDDFAAVLSTVDVLVPARSLRSRRNADRRSGLARDRAGDPRSRRRRAGVRRGPRRRCQCARAADRRRRPAVDDGRRRHRHARRRSDAPTRGQ